MRVDLARGRGIVLGHLEIDRGLLLHVGQHVQAATAATAARHIGRIGHRLQLTQDGAEDDERHVEETCLCDVEDAAVDDDRGVDQDGRQAVPISLGPSAAEEQRRQLGPARQANRRALRGEEQCEHQ